MLSQLTTSKYFSLLFNVALALLIVYNAELGRLMGDKDFPLSISLVWPSTGVALAALLLFGINTWPGIFLGNFGYNLFHLFSPDNQAASCLTAFAISIGSLLQALVGNYVLRKLCTRGYFNTLRDVIYFLLFGGLITCLIAPTIGVLSLYLYKGEDILWPILKHAWLIFWIGDTMGVYIFTPLLVIWSVHKKTDRLAYQHLPELTLMVSAFLAISIAIFFYFSLSLLYLPLSLWITYRYGMHGATLGVFLMTLTLIISTTAGHALLPREIVANPLLFVILLLGIIVSTSLLFAALRNERRRLTG